MASRRLPNDDQPLMKITSDSFDEADKKLFAMYDPELADESKLIDRLNIIRAKALEVNNYQCLRSARFALTRCREHHLYGKVLTEAIHSNSVILDIGCALGTDIRQLVLDGWDVASTYATDLEPSFWDIGCELFNDSAAAKPYFFPGDIFSDEFATISQDEGAPSSNKPSSLNDLRGWVDYVWTGSFFHLFSLEQQIIVAKKLFSLVVSKENGAKVLWVRQRGSAGEEDQSTDVRWLPTVTSWEKMWKFNVLPPGTTAQFSTTVRVEKISTSEMLSWWIKFD